MELTNGTTHLGPPGYEEQSIGSRYRTIAIVEWERSAKLDPVTSLPSSIRRRERVWKGNGISAIRIEFIDRVIGYFDIKIRNRVQRSYVDTDYETETRRPAKLLSVAPHVVSL